MKNFLFLLIGIHHEPYADPTDAPTGPVEESAGGPGEGEGGENGGEGGEENGGEMEEKPPKEHPGPMMGGDTDAEKHKGCMFYTQNAIIKTRPTLFIFLSVLLSYRSN